MRAWVESHFGVVLLLACLGGLAIPGLARVPDNAAVVILAMLTFISCFKLRDGRFRTIDWRRIAVFYVVRYVALPFALYALARTCLPAYATDVFLLALLPAGVSSPAFAGLFAGEVAPAFAVVLVSALAAPLLIPMAFAVTSMGAHAGPSIGPLFVTLAECVVLPMAVYLPLRRLPAFSDWMYGNNKLFAITLVAFVIALVIAKQRGLILADAIHLLPLLAVSLGCYALFIATGWACGCSRPRPERITFAVCSGFNNCALGISLALLHFAPEVILFVAVSEVGWALLPFLLRGFLRVM